MSDDRLYIAVDLGAGSGRVFLAGLQPHELMLEEIRRFRYPPRQADGHLRWDAKQILAEIKTGLRLASERARELRRPIHSLAVDSWGVDYGLLDASGRLLEDPVCYRDRRTDGITDAVFERVPRAEMFARTGIQVMQINTVFQLFAHTTWARIEYESQAGYIKLINLVFEQPAEKVEPAVYTWINAAETVAYGDTITLSAMLAGFEGMEYETVWQYALTDKNQQIISGWNDIEGANRLTYAYILNEQNATWAWRIEVRVQVPDEEAQGN
jgi:rhamnulokinase